MGKINMRQTASECLSRARVLLSRGDEPSVRHACLELRFAIEYITYDQLQSYMKEVSDDALKKWTPKQVISAMLEVDPHADKSAIITFGLEHEYGVPPPPEEMQLLGEDRRFTMKWANKNHNALGNFLHAPTMLQLESGGAPALKLMVGKAMEVANECEHILRSPVINFNFGHFFEFECMDCKNQIRRRSGSFTPEQGVVCTKCGATYDVKSSEDGHVSFDLRQVKFNCHSCKIENWLGIHRLIPGEIVICAACGKKSSIRKQFVLMPEQDANK